MKTKSSNKMLLIALVLLVAGGAWYGYSKQTENLTTNTTTDSAPQAEAAAEKAPSPDARIFKAQKGDIVFGKADAPVTILDYSSLSCPHCAHFHINVLPQLEKEYLNTGKAKLVYRHFPLNASALRAAQLVDCAAPAQRPQFLKALFDTQAQWAFNEGFMEQLKQIAAVGGMDSAQFDSCIADKRGEAHIVEVRRRGAEEAQVNATPAFYIDGVKLNDAADIDAFRDAMKAKAAN